MNQDGRQQLENVVGWRCKVIQIIKNRPQTTHNISNLQQKPRYIYISFLYDGRKNKLYNKNVTQHFDIKYATLSSINKFVECTMSARGPLNLRRWVGWGGVGWSRRVFWSHIYCTTWVHICVSDCFCHWILAKFQEMDYQTRHTLTKWNNDIMVEHITESMAIWSSMSNEEEASENKCDFGLTCKAQLYKENPEEDGLWTFLRFLNCLTVIYTFSAEWQWMSVVMLCTALRTVTITVMTHLVRYGADKSISNREKWKSRHRADVIGFIRETLYNHW